MLALIFYLFVVSHPIGSVATELPIPLVIKHDAVLKGPVYYQSDPHKPVRRITVELYISLQDATSFKSVRTDDQGNYHFEDLKLHTRYWLSASPPNGGKAQQQQAETGGSGPTTVPFILD
jgi:hypothetical protein